MLTIPQTLLEDRRRRQSLALRFGSRKALGSALLGLAVVLALLWSVRLVGQPDLPEGVSERRAVLLEALGPVRPFDGRLVGFEYAPVKPLPAGWRTGEITAAIRAIDDEAELRTSPQALADVGVVELLHGRFDNAVGALTQAARRAPKDARIASDLAAAYLARGEAKQRPYDLILSLSVSLRAVAADSSLPEARFNFALGLEKFFLWAQARRQWEAFVKRFSSEQAWIEEAQVRLKSLDGGSDANWDSKRLQLERAAISGNDAAVREIVANYPQQARKYAEEILLPGWGEAWLEGHDEEATARLSLARAIGEGLASHSGDSMTQEAVSAILKAPSSQVALLAEGHKGFGAGVAFDQKQDSKKALTEFLRASALLAKGESPFRAWAEIDAAICEYYLFRAKGALQRLVEVERSLAKGHISLRARLLWIQGLIKVRKAELSGALDAYENSLAAFKYLGEVENVAALHFLTGECLRYQGESSRAWWHRYQALRAVRRSGESIRFHNTLFDSAEAALRLGHPRVALLFQTEMISSPWALSKPIYMAEAHLRRGITYRRLAQYDVARKDLLEARRQITRIHDDSRRLPLEADLGMASSELVIEESPLQAAEYLNLPIRFHRDRGSLVRVPALLHRRSRAYRAGGRHELQEFDLAEGIRISETIRRELLDEHLRISYFDLAQPLFDDMIDLLQRRGRSEDAFVYSERSRARTLADRYGLDGGGVLGTQEVPRYLPSGLALIEYAVMKDRTIIWVFTASGLRVVEVDVGEVELARGVGELRSLILTGSAGGSRVGRELWELLIGNVVEGLGSVEMLVIVPDKALHELPFAALVSPSGKYLIEDYQIVFSPSATIFAASSHRNAQFPSASQPEVLVVSDPAMDRERAPYLPALPGSASEAEAILATYGNGKILYGEDARKASILHLAPRYEVLHLGAHALVNTEYPLLSSIVLAPGDRSGSDLLFAHELYREHFAQVRLVVLAACDSLAGQVSGGEGVMSLARPFLASGVPTVVGSLWQVDDDGSREVWLMLHELVARGVSPAGAMRQAQLSLLKSLGKSHRSVASWAGFQVVGSNKHLFGGKRNVPSGD